MPKRKTREYTKGFMGSFQRRKEERELFAEGYEIESEEEYKKWEAGNACCLALIFLPLIFVRTKKIKVVYVLCPIHGSKE